MSFSLPAFVEVPLITDLSATTVELTWKTPVSTTARIEYTYEGGTFSSLAPGPDLVTDHFVRLTGLQPLTLYSYEVFNLDSEGNTLAASGSFKTK